MQPKLPIAGVTNLIAVGSGKGGVGKTTVAVTWPSRWGGWVTGPVCWMPMCMARTSP
jgi:hypothetical protein